MRINRERLEKNLFNLGKIGKNEEGGIDRALSSRADAEARNWLMAYWKEKLGLITKIDAIANLFIQLEGKEVLPPILLGSHHDAVPNGGMYDGALGVLAATEVVETIKESGITTRHPIGVVSFTGEEPNPYNVSTLGSKVLSGRLTKADLEKLKHLGDGSPLGDCIKSLGGDINKADEIKINEGDISAFIELHIEQGKRLIERKRYCATVSTITGIYRENVTIYGDANHGGTTIMQDRQDALLAACEFNLAFEELVKNEGNDEVVGTIGQLRVYPGEVSIIPGKVELVLEIRTCEPEIRKSITKALDFIKDEIEGRRGVKIHRQVNLDQPAMPMDAMVMEAVTQGIATLGEGKMECVSMAGHDAANMARVTKAGMLFVQSENGKSHCPKEYTGMEAIEQAANALLEAVLLLDKALDSI